MKGYSLSIQKFIRSQHVSTGIRMTVCVLLPAYLLFHYGLLGKMMAIPLGALFIALADQPGPLHHRINGMIAGIVLNFFIVCIAGSSAGIEWLAGIEILFFSFVFSMFSVYDSRADAVGLIALIAFIISYGSLSSPQHPFIYTALYFTAGGVWYLLFSIITNRLQPYKFSLQLLGEYLIETGHYLRERSAFYDKRENTDEVLKRLIPYHITIQQQQASLRELLFKTRLIVKQSTNKGRRLMMLFLESTDLLERLITSQQDYKELHHQFDNTDILNVYRQNLLSLADALVYTGLAVQNNDYYNSEKELENAFLKSNEAFASLRKQLAENAANASALIKLRRVLYSIEDVTERIKRLQQFTRASVKVSKVVRKEELDPFTNSQNFNIKLLLSNLSLQSSQFRHAIRLTIAMFIGVVLSFLFPLGHSYWILLAIATILKPAFATSRKRNIERVGGTFIGVALAFSTLHLFNTDTPIFITMLSSMLIAYSFFRLNNLVSTSAITLYVVLSFHFLYPAGVGVALRDRIVDTIAGALIALPTSYLIFPTWEHKNLGAFLFETINNNNKYFNAVAKFFNNNTADIMLQYKLARKAAFVSIANVSDALQRMLNEPKSKQPHLTEYHQLVTANYMLTSYIASLAYYAEQYRNDYNPLHFKPLIQFTSRQFELLKQMAQQPGIPFKGNDVFPIDKKMRDVIAQQRLYLQSTINDPVVVEDKLSIMKTIRDQLLLINAAVEDLMKILEGFK